MKDHVTYMVMMEQDDDNDLSINNVNLIDHKRMKSNKDKSNEYNQCDYAFSRAGNLRLLGQNPNFYQLIFLRAALILIQNSKSIP